MRERRHPKLYWVDPGLVRAAKRHLGPLATEERGALFEGWILTVLRAHHEAAPIFDDISYWAPAEARVTEVDFLLRRGREYLALEVKTRTRVSAEDFTGLRAIASLDGMVRRILVYLGSRRLRTEDGIEVWPLATWLSAVAEGRLWP